MQRATRKMNTAMLETVELNAQQSKLWENTRACLLFNYPSFTHIWYEMLDKQGRPGAAIFMDKEHSPFPVAATDGAAIFINVDEFFKFDLQERVFILVHEIMHCILNHCNLMHLWSEQGDVPFADGKRIEYDQQQMNVAMDYVINDLLVTSQVGKLPHRDGKPYALWDKSKAVGTDVVVDAYRKLYKKQPTPPPGGGGGCEGNDGEGDGNGHGNFDGHLKPGTSTGQDANTAAKSRNESEWKQQIEAAANAARAQGKLPAGLDHFFKELLEPQVDWTEKIQAMFARKVGSGGWDWRRPDNRYINDDTFFPSRSGFGAECVVVGCDTSGSIGDRELDMFFAELSGILEEVKPKQLFIIWCDAEVGRVDECDDPSDLNILRHKGVPGRGGTDFRPVFDEVAKRGLTPDALVYLTDGCGPFPTSAPNYPVIWGNIYEGAKYPFGEVVDIPKQAA